MQYKLSTLYELIKKIDETDVEYISVLVDDWPGCNWFSSRTASQVHKQLSLVITASSGPVWVPWW